MTISQTPVREALSKPVITAFWLGYFQEGFRRNVFEGLLKLFEERNMIKRDIAKRLNKKPEQITRWLSGPSNIESDTISDLALSMGYVPKITFEPLDRESEVRPNQLHPITEQLRSADLIRSPTKTSENSHVQLAEHLSVKQSQRELVFGASDRASGYP